MGDLDGDVMAMSITTLRDHRWYRGSPRVGLEATSWVFSGLAVQVDGADVNGDGYLDLFRLARGTLSVFGEQHARPATAPGPSR